MSGRAEIFNAANDSAFDLMSTMIPAILDMADNMRYPKASQASVQPLAQLGVWQWARWIPGVPSGVSCRQQELGTVDRLGTTNLKVYGPGGRSRPKSVLAPSSTARSP